MIISAQVVYIHISLITLSPVDSHPQRLRYAFLWLIVYVIHHVTVPRRQPRFIDYWITERRRMRRARAKRGQTLNALSIPTFPHPLYQGCQKILAPAKTSLYYSGDTFLKHNMHVMTLTCVKFIGEGSGEKVGMTLVLPSIPPWTIYLLYLSPCIFLLVYPFIWDWSVEGLEKQPVAHWS